MTKLILLGIVAHLIGDYILQNDYIANQKTKKTLPAIIHVLLYGIPFYFLVGFSYSLFFIITTHFLIDRFRLAVYWINLINWNWKSNNFGFDDNKPIWMSVWLMIIYDNIFHIILNTIAIYYYCT
jgi:hypothetical protein